MSIRAAILNVLYPVIRLVGDLNIGPRYRWVKYAKALAATQLLAEGDVLCTFAAGELTNLFIGGLYKHSGIYIKGRVLESTRDGVHFTNVFDFLMSKDEFCVVRPSFPFSLGRLVISAYKYQGMPYDYFFEPGLKAFTCAELVGQVLADSAGKEIPFTKRKILGVLTIHPTDFVEAKDKFTRVF